MPTGLRTCRHFLHIFGEKQREMKRLLPITIALTFAARRTAPDKLKTVIRHPIK